MAYIVKVERLHGKPVGDTMRKAWESLPDGVYEVAFKPVRKTNSRYNYYFGVVLAAILDQVGELFQIDGKRIETTEQLHQIMKLIYNRGLCVNTRTGEVLPVGMTTTCLNDGDFINRFQEQIIADFSSDPYYVEF